ncbi:hypothetical protein IJ579_07145 [bacterium]|nr:hypothetical protein [bacterium]
MERIIKFLIFFIIFNACCLSSFAFDEINLNSLLSTQYVKYENCTKVFNTGNVNLLYLTIAAVNANRFKIDEIQSESGYVLFTAVNKQFLASVSNVNTNQGMLKITPADGNYFFQPGIVSNIFKYVDINLSKTPEVINLK